MRTITFDVATAPKGGKATLLKPGTSTMTLTVKGGPVTARMLYDYLRLELDETATFAASW